MPKTKPTLPLTGLAPSRWLRSLLRVAQITPDVRQIGVRTGSVCAIISIAALTSNPVGGALYEIWGDRFTGLQIFCGVTQLVGATAILAARVALKGVKIKVKV